MSPANTQLSVPSFMSDATLCWLERLPAEPAALSVTPAPAVIATPLTAERYKST